MHAHSLIYFRKESIAQIAHLDHQMFTAEINNWKQLTCVCVKADGSVETFPLLQNFQSKCDLWTLPLLLDPEQCSLQVQPEADLLESRTRCWISVQSGHLGTNRCVEVLSRYDKNARAIFRMC